MKRLIDREVSKLRLEAVHAPKAEDIIHFYLVGFVGGPHPPAPMGERKQDTLVVFRHAIGAVERSGFGEDDVSNRVLHACIIPDGERFVQRKLEKILCGLRSAPGLHGATVVVAVVLATLHARKRLAKADIVVQQSQDELVLARERLVGEGEEGTDEERVGVEDFVLHACIIPHFRGNASPGRRK